ncbi:enoyl-CoA hydratase-related protein [soil metagenome]
MSTETTPEAPPLLSSIEDYVLTLTINRPHRKNAMNREAWDALFDILRSAAVDDDVRVVVLQGSDHTFCAGADISGVPTGHPLNRIRHISRTAEALYSFPKPVIAKVEGAAVGAGWNLALCCDLVVASSTAKFSAIFASRGLSLDFGGSWLLPRLAGLQQAKRLAFLAEFITAAETKELGLSTWVKEPDEIDAFVDEIAGKMAKMPPLALAQNKEILNAGVVSPFREALDTETRAQTVNYATEDAPIAIRAFKDKTDPTYTGKWAL